MADQKPGFSDKSIAERDLLLEEFSIARKNTKDAYQRYEELNSKTFQAKMYAEQCEKKEKEIIERLFKKPS